MKCAVIETQIYQTLNIIKMKTTKRITSLTKAFFILLVSGWRCVDWFGLPEPNKSVLITSGDGSIIDVAQRYTDERGYVCWQQGGLSNELIPVHRNAEFWKPLPKSPWRAFRFACC